MTKQTGIQEVQSKKLNLLDVNLASFLQLCGIPPKLELNNGRVIFTFTATDELYKLMNNYNSNVNVPILDYVTTLKTLRSQMLSMRGGQK